MANTTGWMKIHRRFTAWEWFGCAEMVQLFVWLLLSASDRDVRRRGVALRRGQVLVSQRKLAVTLCSSYKRVRTCLAKLQSTGEITTTGAKGAQGYTIVTICNYDVYQAPANGDGRIKGALSDPLKGALRAHLNNSMPTDCNTTDNEEGAKMGAKMGAHIYKNKEDNGGGGSARPRTREEAIERLRRDIYSSPLKIESALRATRVETQAQLYDLCEEVFADWAMTDKGSVDWAHLRNQLLIKAEAQRREAAKMASIPKPQQSVKEWRQKLAADVMKGVALNQAFNNKKNS